MCRFLLSKRSREFILLGLVFVISRTIFYSWGVQFDASPLDSYVQIIDPVLLRTRFWESIYYLHSQPPLFNIFLGVILKLFPANYVPVFQICYLGLGIVFTFTLFSLMKRMRVNIYVNFFLTVLFMISPAVILYENWLFYSYPVAVGLCLAALYLHKYMESGRGQDGAVFFFLLMVLVLLRAIFHFVWLLLFALLLIFLKKGHRKQVLAVGIIPILIVFAWHLKNAYIFKKFTTSPGMLGAVVARMAVSYLTDSELAQIIKEKEVSKISLLEPGRPMAYDPAYAKYFKTPRTGIPILDKPYRGDDTHRPNLNSLYVLQVSKIYLKDGLHILKRFPQAYCRALQRSYFVYLFPGPTDIDLKNRDVIRDYENHYNFMFFYLNAQNSQDIRWYSSRNFPIQWDWISCLFLMGVIVYYAGLNIFGWATLFSSRKKSEDPAFVACLFFMTANIVYVTLIINGLDVMANNRYRFPIDAFYLTLCGMLLTRWIGPMKGARRGLLPGPKEIKDNMESRP